MPTTDTSHMHRMHGRRPAATDQPSCSCIPANPAQQGKGKQEVNARGGQAFQ